MRFLPFVVLLGCNPDPGEIGQGVGYRDDYPDDEGNSGERGSVKISEILWSGSVTDDGTWDVTDVFVELRNESNRPVDVTGWRLDLEGAIAKTFLIPEGPEIGVSEHRFAVAKTSGCFSEADWIIPGLAFPNGDPFRLTLRDADERLMESAGSKDHPPFAGGYDLAVSRSMEKIELMFGGQGTEPASWHHYTDVQVDIPNDDKVLEICRARTFASPGRPNSPDYSGSYASGSFE